MKILLTAFDAFGGESINPALKAVFQVKPPAGTDLIRLEVPTVFGKSIDVVAAAIEREHPDAVVCVGQAGGRSAVTPERIAINLMDASIPDNEGNMPVDLPIIPEGENALFSTLPVKAIIAAIQSAGIPSQISNSAGTFVCNQLMYGVLHLCRAKYPKTIAGFIHVPFLPEQTVRRPGTPCLPLDRITAALEAAVRCIAETHKADPCADVQD